MNDSFIVTRDASGYREVTAALLAPDRYGLTLQVVEAIRRLFKASEKGQVSFRHHKQWLTITWSPFAGTAGIGAKLYSVEIDAK